MEINQGDAVAGEIKRADVAECAIACATSKKIPRNTIFEIYNVAGKGPLEGDQPMPTGYERTGDNYEALLTGLVGGSPVQVDRVAGKSGKSVF